MSAVAKFETELPLNEKMCHTKLRELFEQNKDVSDIRNIDLLVIRVSVNLKETV